MDEHQARMNQVKRGFRQSIAHNVVAPDLEVRQLHSVQKPRIDICNDYTAACAYFAAEPASDRSTSTAHLQTAPAVCNAEILQMPHGAGIEHGGQCAESRGSFSASIVEEVGSLSGRARVGRCNRVHRLSPSF